jgi:hypothetical protein
MRRRTWALAGLAATAVVAAGGIAPAGTGSFPGVTATASAAALRGFDDCRDMLDWYVDAALPHVGPYGLAPAMIAYDMAATARPEARAGADTSAAGDQGAVGSGATGTNVQETGVDEPDVAKTDGRLVAHVDRTGQQPAVVLTDVGGGRPRELSRIPLPESLLDAELLLAGDALFVLGSETPFRIQSAERIVPPGPQRPQTQVMAVDVSVPALPRRVSVARYGGSLLSARQHDGIVRLVLSTPSPDIDWVRPGRGRKPAEATARNRELLRESTAADWLPAVSGEGTGDGPLLTCEYVRHPRDGSGFGTISVVTFDASTPGERDATAVTASGDLVYASAERLYVATSAWGWWPMPVEPGVDARDGRPREEPRTEVHAFALDGATTDYVASGEVTGRVRDRWSFSEHRGYLRVATELGSSWRPRENGVVVLQEQGESLVRVGRVAGMGRGEQIQSVRWFDDLAVLVTFRQVDPLYTVDLAVPTDPTVVGELKIPGFSAYLHPIGGDLLLGLGQDASLQGRQRGAQVSTFDLTDLADPRRVDSLRLGRHSQFLVDWDSRAFTYLPDRRVALAPLQDGWTGRLRLLQARVGEDGALSPATVHDLGPWRGAPPRSLPVDGGRVAVVHAGKVTLLLPST